MRDNKLILLVIIALAFCFGVSRASQPSFDCGKAKTGAEIAICGSSELSELDKAMSIKYLELKKALNDVDLRRFTNQQLSWLKSRERLCRNKWKRVSCLRELYTNRIDLFDILLSGSDQNLVTRYDFYRVDDHGVRWENDKLIFSGFNETGNNFDVFELDPITGVERVIFRDRPNAKFIAQSEKYLLFSEKGSAARPLVLVDAKTGNKIHQIKLKHAIKWAEIANDRLTIIQGAHKPGIAANEVTIFDLPDLKAVKSIYIEGGNYIQKWKESVVVKGRQITIYDKYFNEVLRSNTIPTSHPTRNISCSHVPFQIHKSKAVTVSSCVDIRIYDLATLKLERTISLPSTPIALAVNDELIFASLQDPPGEGAQTHVFDFKTGTILDNLQLGGSDLFLSNDYLIAVRRQFAKRALISLYKYEPTHLKDRDSRFGKVRIAYKDALRTFTETGDIYEAIDRCNTAGISGLISESELPKDILNILHQYSIWLSESFDQYGKAVPILEYLRKHLDADDIDILLNTVKLKETFLGGTDSRQYEKNEIPESPFANSLSFGGDVAKRVPVVFGASTKFVGDRIYAAVWGNSLALPGAAGGAALVVYDRNTFALLKLIDDLVPYNDQYQDSITDIAVDENYIYLNIEYRYPDPKRTNFIILDKDSLGVIDSMHINSFADERITGSPYSFEPKNFCSTFDSDGHEAGIHKDYVCIVGPSASDKMLLELHDELGNSKPESATDNFIIFNNAKYRKPSKFVFKHKYDKNRNITFDANIDYRAIAIPESDKVVMYATHNNGARHFSIFDIPSEKHLNILRLATARNKYPVFALNHQYMFIGYGRDLLIIDNGSHKAVKYIHGFISEGFENNGHGVDRNKISGMTIDDDRLIVITHSGENSRVVEWRKLVGSR